MTTAHATSPSRVELFRLLADLVSEHSRVTAMAVMRGTRVPEAARAAFEKELRRRGFLDPGKSLAGMTVGDLLEQVSPDNAR